MKPFITLTGADERTDLEVLAKLDAEIGLLYTFDPEGRPRYPSRAWIARAAERLPRVAIHVCGLRARQQLAAGELGDLVAHAQRIQVNGTRELPFINDICAQYYSHTIITQHTSANRYLLVAKADNHVLLVDASGGRGVSPERWTRPDTTKPVGFAGGLGPHNLYAELTKIKAVARDEWWVDMEGKLRDDNDWFSLAKAAECERQFHEFFLPA